VTVRNPEVLQNAAMAYCNWLAPSGEVSEKVNWKKATFTRSKRGAGP
jgi:hypothetical protein